MILAVALSYLVGSIPTAFILVKLIKKIDIREHGSGNVGATNVFRVAGKELGVAVLLIDMLKGFVAPFYLAHLVQSSAEQILATKLICGVSAIAGHTWPIWLKFKGGKGVATSCGVFLGIAPIAVLCSLSVWIALAFTTKYVSVSSIGAAVLFPVWVYLIYRDTTLALISIALAGFIIFTHRSNLERLKNRTERKIGSKKS